MEKEYEVSVTYTMMGKYKVRASSYEEACAIALGPDVGLPEVSHYLDDSMQIAAPDEE